MMVELSKSSKKLLSEIDRNIYFENNNFIVIDDCPNYITGNHEILDGNHRAANAIQNKKTNELNIYSIEYAIYKNIINKLNIDNKDFSNQVRFEKLIKRLGKKINNNEVTLID